MDSDALIKISKADFLDILAQKFDLIITEEVYDETVKEGKKGLYPDAYKIEKLVASGKIRMLKATSYIKKKKPKKSFGKGEASLYQAYKNGMLIVSDDLNFWSYVQDENKKILSSAHLVHVLVKKGALKKAEAYSCLEKLRPFVRKEIYELVKKEIHGG